MNLENKVALVTGASRGIGAAIADHLGQLGASVIGTATSDNGAAAISQRFAEKNITGSGMKLDVQQADQIAAVIERIEKEYGAPTVLVNNAGITRDNLMMRMKDEEWDDVINTNLSAVFRVTKACLRGMMKARWGRIISIGSVVGGMGNAGQCNYAATKAGVAGFSRSLAREVGSRGITVNAVAPGFIDTDMTRELTEEQSAAMLSAIPLGRFGDVQEIAEVVGFLATSGSYISGETIQVNGGMYMA